MLCRLEAKTRQRLNRLRRLRRLPPMQQRGVWTDSALKMLPPIAVNAESGLILK